MMGMMRAVERSVKRRVHAGFVDPEGKVLLDEEGKPFLSGYKGPTAIGSGRRILYNAEDAV